MNQEIKFSVSCIVPARNESGHLEKLIGEIVTIEAINEIIIVEGGSSDNTYEVALSIALRFPEKVKVLRQSGVGKFNAVLNGASHSVSTHILIWDADATVSSKQTKEIIQLAKISKASVIGDRLRGKIEKGAMRPANWVGNWAFALFWAMIIFNKPADMLCGTKIFPKNVFLSLPGEFVKRDPFGDFALVANAIRLEEAVISHVVDYGARAYGQTNIKRWNAGFKLLVFSFYVLTYKMNKKWPI